MRSLTWPLEKSPTKRTKGVPLPTTHLKYVTPESDPGSDQNFNFLIWAQAEQFKYCKTFQVDVFKPMGGPPWPNKAFSLNRHNQFNLTREPMPTMNGAQSFFIYQGMNTWNPVYTSQNLPSTCFRTTGITTMAKSRFCSRPTSPV